MVPRLGLPLLDGLGTDVIVGYPGETDEHFETTYENLRTLPFMYFHVFSYSERDEAKGHKVHTDKVAPQVIAERSRRLRELSERKLGLVTGGTK